MCGHSFYFKSGKNAEVAPQDAAALVRVQVHTWLCIGCDIGCKAWDDDSGGLHILLMYIIDISRIHIFRAVCLL